MVMFLTNEHAYSHLLYQQACSVLFNQKGKSPVYCQAGSSSLGVSTMVGLGSSASLATFSETGITGSKE